jgi:hypothetical protein
MNLVELDRRARGPAHHLLNQRDDVLNLRASLDVSLCDTEKGLRADVKLLEEDHAVVLVVPVELDEARSKRKASVMETPERDMKGESSPG